MHKLVILHKEHPKSSAGEVPLDGVLDAKNEIFRGFFYWRTCVRSLWIGFVSEHDLGALSDLSEAFEVLTGEAAYCFLLEVVCGLKSPLVGETEVAGQFRNFYSSQDIDLSYFAHEWKKLFSSLMSDLKWVRSSHLIGLGSQSYGSLARRLLKGHSGITMIGGGHLAGEILPWLNKDHNDMTCIVRRAEARKELKTQFPKVQFCGLETFFSLSNEALVIAAPVRAYEVMEWLKTKQFSLKTIIDLRENSEIDKIQIADSVTLLTLNDFFQMIQQNKTQLEEKVQLARNAIHGRTQERFLEQSLRPFGWDDVCA